MILKPGTFPIQDDPEIVSLPRYEVDADQNGKHTDPDTGSDERISRREWGDQVHRPEPGREVRVDTDHIDRAGILCFEQEAPRYRARTAEQAGGIEPASDHTADTEVPAKRRDSATSRNAATICRQVHKGGFGVAD